MALTDDQIKVAVRAEIDNDPGGLGYAAVTGTEAEINAGIAAKLNAKGVSVTDPFTKVQRDRVVGWELVGALVYGEYASLTQMQRDLFETIVACGQIDPRDTNIRTIFGQMFGVGTTTRTNLLNLEYRIGSRAENLFGAGFEIKVWHVGQARAL